MSLDPMWVSVGIAATGIVFTGITAYQAARRGTEVAVARMEERHSSLKEQVVRLTETQDAHAELLSDHETRVAVLERWPLREPPLDYSR